MTNRPVASHDSERPKEAPDTPFHANLSPAQSRCIGTASVIWVTLLALRNSWVADDAYITLRTIDNLFQGCALGFNCVERVQAYTHPLWLLCLTVARFLTGELHYTTIAFGVACTALAAYWLVFRVATNQLVGAGIVGLLTLSRTFLDFSVCGLENPLTHLLLALTLSAYCSGAPAAKQLRRVSWLAGLTMLNRLDAVLLVAPLVGHCVLRCVRSKTTIRAMGPALWGLAPLFVWELFSLLYYGFLVPNTAYAKLGSAIPQSQLTHQGLLYLGSTLHFDPVVPLLLVLAVASQWPLWRSTQAAAALGIVSYVAYVVWVGGDFMNGRFLTPPLFLAASILSQGGVAATPLGMGVLYVSGTILAYAHLPFSHLNINPQPATGPAPTNSVGVANERAHFIQNGTLASATRVPGHPQQFRWYQQGRRALARQGVVVKRSAIGYFGFAAGPNRHVVDFNGLADPLLARLPAKYNPQWRQGHFARKIPAGYIASLESGQSMFRDKNLGRYWVHLSDIIRGPIWRASRWERILRFHLGHYEHLIDYEKYRYPGMKRQVETSLHDKIPEGTSTKDPRVTRFGISGLEVQLEKKRAAAWLHASLDANDNYRLVFFSESEGVGEVLVRSYHTDNLHLFDVPVPEGATRRGYDRIRIFPAWGEEPYAIGHLSFSSQPLTRHYETLGPYEH